MKLFKATVEGRGFTLPVDGVLRRIGFVTTREVLANNVTQAKHRLLKSFKAEDKFRKILGASTSQGEVHLVELLHCDVPSLNPINPGYAFFPDD